VFIYAFEISVEFQEPLKTNLGKVFVVDSMGYET
jgi:hypothetical protein